MLGKDISEALGGISQEMVDAARACGNRGKTRSIWFRVAAVAATLAIILTAALWPQKMEDEKTITSPGFLKVYAYDLSSGVAISEQEGVDLADSIMTSPSNWFSGMNRYYGLPLTLKITDERLTDKVITFDVTVEHGSFYGDYYSGKYDLDNDGKQTWSEMDLGSVFTIDNGENIYWHDKLVEEEARNAGVDLVVFLDSIGNVNYMDVIVKADDQIIGYAVIEIRNRKDLYSAYVRDVVSYMTENGELQEVTEEYVRQEIANCKAVQ